MYDSDEKRPHALLTDNNAEVNARRQEVPTMGCEVLTWNDILTYAPDRQPSSVQRALLTV